MDRSSGDAPGHASSPRRTRVLVIDDEPLIGRIVERILADEHDVVTLNRAGEALERLRAGEQFDVILCDLFMPGMDGPTFHNELARVMPEMAGRVVFLSGGAYTDQMRAFLASTDRLHLEKPFDRSQLLQVVAAVTGKHAGPRKST
jgi:CheY-like chemotaxis protein